MKLLSKKVYLANIPLILTCMRLLNCILILALVTGISACTNTKMETVEHKETNVLIRPWEGAYGGVPPFDKVTLEQFSPAIEWSINEKLEEVNLIATNAEAPDFENTLAAFERCGRSLDRVLTVFYIWSNNMSDTAFQKIESEVNPKLAALNDKIVQNEKLFARIKAVYESPELRKLTPEQQRLAWFHYTRFVHSGAQLDATAKSRLTAINQELAQLFTKFSQHVLADENTIYITVTKKEELHGLPQSMIDAAKEYAVSKNIKEGWAIANTRSSIDPLLTFASNRSLREKAWKMFKNRGDNGNENDNNAVIADILRLRAERARLLGFKTHADLMLDDKMARTPGRAMQLMEEVWKPAVQRVKEEVADMQATAKKEDAAITIEPWDYLYYAEKVRKQRYNLDQNELKPYMQLDKLREGMFWVAGELFGFTFEPSQDVPVYHPDVRVWKVKTKTSDQVIGLWYFDPYARAGKRSGAWMNNYRGQQKMDGPVIPIVSNNSNFMKGKPGEPVLISYDDATTLFHEFGHALHGLSSNVTYPSLQSPNVASDFVEFPSQLMEHWFTTPEVLNVYALHYQTGKPIPNTLIDKIYQAKTFNSGYATVEYLSAAIVDMKLHLEGDKPIDADTYERETLKALGMPSAIAMRHRLPQFLHIFSDDGYSAGYYSYLWSEVISADAYKAFIEAGGPYDRTVSKKYYTDILSVGNTIDPAEAYRLFRGRDPKIDELMEERGFTHKVTATK